MPHTKWSQVKVNFEKLIPEPQTAVQEGVTMKFALTDREDLATGVLGASLAMHLDCGAKLAKASGSRYGCSGCGKSGLLVVNPLDAAKLGYPGAPKQPKPKAVALNPQQKAKLANLASCNCKDCKKDHATLLYKWAKEAEQLAEASEKAPEKPEIDEYKTQAVALDSELIEVNPLKTNSGSNVDYETLAHQVATISASLKASAGGLIDKQKYLTHQAEKLKGMIVESKLAESADQLSYILNKLSDSDVDDWLTLDMERHPVMLLSMLVTAGTLSQNQFDFLSSMSIKFQPYHFSKKNSDMVDSYQQQWSIGNWDASDTAPLPDWHRAKVKQAVQEWAIEEASKLGLSFSAWYKHQKSNMAQAYFKSSIAMKPSNGLALSASMKNAHEIVEKALSNDWLKKTASSASCVWESGISGKYYGVLNSDPVVPKSITHTQIWK